MNEKGKRARCCDGNFLLAETELVMTTVMSAHVKGKNCIFTGYQTFRHWKNPGFSSESIINTIVLGTNLEKSEKKKFTNHSALRKNNSRQTKGSIY